MESSPHGLLGKGKVEFFGGKSHDATSRNYIAQLVLKKKFQSNLAKRFFDRAFITFYYNLRNLLCQQTTAESKEKVNDREQESARVEQAKTIVKLSFEEPGPENYGIQKSKILSKHQSVHNYSSVFMDEQERAYSGAHVSSAWRLDGEMRRRLILQET